MSNILSRFIISTLFLLFSFALAAPSFTSLEQIEEILTSHNITPRIGKTTLWQYYQQRQGNAAWISNDKTTHNAQALLDIVIQSHNEGLRPEDYHATSIKNYLTKNTLSTADQNIIEILLTDAFLSYARDMGQGRPEFKALDKQWLLPSRKPELTKLLEDAIHNNSVTDTLNTLIPDYRMYAVLKSALPKYRQLAEQNKQFTKITTSKTLEKGMRGESIQQLRKRLIELEILAPDEQGDFFDDTLEVAVKKFQQQHTLDDDGRVGSRTLYELNLSAQDRLAQIEINLERWRWMPKQLGGHYLVVDLTGFEYFIVKSGTEMLRGKTVVGMAQRPTPVFAAPMKYIVFSPYWHLPHSIAVKDKLPQLRKDPYALERSGIRIYNRQGHEIDPGMIDWNAYNQRTFPYSLRQDPGNANALGKVKFMFPNEHAIYLHDTPQRSLFNRIERTFSSGCIRVENPLDLAEYLLKDRPEWNEQKILNAYNRGKESTVHLPKDDYPMVYILYMTVWGNSENQLVFRPDIYKRDSKMIDAIKKLDL